MAKYLFKVTKLVSDTEFEPRSFASRPDPLNPYVILALLLKKNKKTTK